MYTQGIPVILVYGSLNQRHLDDNKFGDIGEGSRFDQFDGHQHPVAHHYIATRTVYSYNKRRKARALMRLNAKE
jgi:hypothetical protein